MKGSPKARLKNCKNLKGIADKLSTEVGQS